MSECYPTEALLVMFLGYPHKSIYSLTVNGVTRISLNNHTHWDTITNRPLTDEQFQDLLEIASLWKLDNDGNLYTERNVYSHGEYLHIIEENLLLLLWEFTI